jgi:hypothetical protein
MEIDCINLRNSLIDQELDNGMNAVVIKGARMLLCLNFHMYHVTYCPREVCGAQLAKFGACIAWCLSKAIVFGRRIF